MRISKADLVAGYPAVEIRNCLRKAGDSTFVPTFLGDAMGIPSVDARRLVKALAGLGLIERDPTCKKIGGEGPCWRVTLNGRTFALAKASRPLPRRSAEKRVAEFLKRVKTVRDDPGFLYRVKRVVAFGSYLEDTATLGDIDLAVELVAKERNPERAHQINEKRIREAREHGRRFSNIVDELYWPQREVMLFLKSRSRSLSLHDTDDPILSISKTRVLFEG